MTTKTLSIAKVANPRAGQRIGLAIQPDHFFEIAIDGQVGTDMAIRTFDAAAREAQKMFDAYKDRVAAEGNTLVINLDQPE